MRYLSLFDGIGAACVAWQPLGWECVGTAEIDPFPCAVTKHHRPAVPQLGDITKITDDQIAGLGRIDLIVGGFPCQDLSVAGKRAGLKNDDGTITRSGLFFDAMRIVRIARERCGLRWLLIENVPGLYSSNAGRDFAAVVGEMVGTEFGVPRGGWANAGVAAGPEGLCEWSTLDAQFFGLAQRRVRVFALADFGDWQRRPPVLFEPASLRGDSPPSREAGKSAPTIPSRRTAGGGLGTDFDCDGGLIAGTLGSNHGNPQLDQTMIPTVSPALKARDYKGPSSDGDGDGAPLIVHALRGEGFDASEDGTGRGTPLVPVHAFDARQYGDKTGPLDTDGHSVAVALDWQNSAGGPNSEETFQTLCKDRHPAVMQHMAVRRLTPRECERLQGFPDDYTLIPYRKKPAADGPRYKALGNSMAVPVMAWIGKRIQMVSELGE
jgi:DNA (cytosine-5)-methyltransferase 1